MKGHSVFSRWARGVFALHFTLVVVIGAALLIMPAAFCSWLGYQVGTNAQPALCAWGAMLLGLGGAASLFGLLARSWEQVDYILRIEVLYLALQMATFIGAALAGRGPALANGLLAAFSGVLLVLFAILYLLRPGQPQPEPRPPAISLPTNAEKRA